MHTQRANLIFALLFSGCSTAASDSPAGVGAGGTGPMGGSSSEGGAGGGKGTAEIFTHGPDTHAALSRSELERRVTFLASDDLDGRDEGTAGGDEARAFIIEELEACGVRAAGKNGSFEQRITTGDGTNILGVIEGTDSTLSAEHVALSAHYDHLGECNGICNGANDNAAAVAILMGVACAFAAEPPKRSILIAAWDAEEPPTFLSGEMGSEFFVAHPTVPLDAINVSIVMDLVGGELWPGYGGHFALGAELSPAVRETLSKVETPEGLSLMRGGLHTVEEQPVGHQPWSDYDAFRNVKLPVLFLSNGQNKRYHTAFDEVQHLNLDNMALQARYLVRVSQALATASAKPEFDENGTDYATDVSTMKQLLDDALEAGGLVDALDLTPSSKKKLEADRDKLDDVETAIAAGSTLSEDDIQKIRNAAQRVMCLAGSSYAETVCGIF